MRLNRSSVAGKETDKLEVTRQTLPLRQDSLSRSCLFPPPSQKTTVSRFYGLDLIVIYSNHNY